MFQFHHVALSVSDIEKSVAFYGALGFSVELEWTAPDRSLTIVHMSLQDAVLELFAYSRNSTSVPSNTELNDDLQQVGVKHFALGVVSLDGAKKHLIAAGLDSGTDVTHGRTGLNYFFVRDPDGLWVEVVETGSENAR